VASLNATHKGNVRPLPAMSPHFNRLYSKGSPKTAAQNKSKEIHDVIQFQWEEEGKQKCDVICHFSQIESPQSAMVHCSGGGSGDKLWQLNPEPKTAVFWHVFTAVTVTNGSSTSSVDHILAAS
jgi:hypothetical protein